jgi:UDP-N-acetylmuramoyl-tripeptide--D-alanyl-D-alanine ligase
VLSRACIAAFGEGARHFATVEALIIAALGELRPQTTMLVKGSRFMRMERVVEALAGEPSSAGGH